jgi:hypothetical protein
MPRRCEHGCKSTHVFKHIFVLPNGAKHVKNNWTAELGEQLFYGLWVAKLFLSFLRLKIGSIFCRQTWPSFVPKAV